MAGTFTTDEVKADIISEKTAGSGVTIDGVLIKDGVITTTGPTIESVDPAITALGVDDTDGYVLTEKINIITGGAVNTGVELMTAVVGLEVVIVNTTASDKKIYAGASDGIDDKTTTTGYIIIHPEQVVRLYCYTVALWQSDIESAAFYQSLVTDSIDEFSADNGVDVDGVTMKDGGIVLADGAAIDADIINEATAAAGVTADGVLLKDGGVTATAPILSPVGAVGTPAVQIGSVDKGFYEVSVNQLGVAVDGALVALFDAEGIMTDSVRKMVNIGTTPVGTVSVAEYGNGRDVTTILTLTNFVVGALAGAGAALAMGNIVYAFPAGQHFELVSSLSALVLTAAGTAVATDTGLGSVIAAGAVATLDGTGTFEDRLTGQTISTAAGGGAAVSALAAATAGIGTGISLNVAASIKNVFLNSAGTWNADNVGSLTASGTIVLKWTIM